MIPVLFDKTADTFDTLGIGALADTVDCTVTEERNGAFTLSAKIPATNEFVDSLNVSNLIVADASPKQKRQAFEIYSVKKSLDGFLNIKANHISYRLLYSIMRPFDATGISTVFTRLGTKSTANYIDGNTFKFITDIVNTSTEFNLTDYRSVKNLLGGTDGSILQAFGGCYKYDNFKVYLLASRGADNGAKLLYGKNLTETTAEYDLGTIPTAVFPIWTNGSTIVTGTAVQESAYRSLYPYRRTVVHDFNDQYDSQPAAATLNTAGAAWINGKGAPSVNLNVSLVVIDDEEMDAVEIDDTVMVRVPSLDIDVSAKVIKTVYEPMKDRYRSVEVGNFRTSITDAIRSVRGK